jgi:3'5'-cyclic nucleotide phosphodiesterase
MGCFGSRSPKEINSEDLNNNLITSNYLKLSEIPLIWNKEIMKPITFPSSQPIIKRINQSQIEEIRDLNFTVFSKTISCLKNYAYYIFTSRGFSSPKLSGLLEVISLNYPDNPFHNFYHGFAVFQMIYVISERNSNFSSYLYEKEEGLLLLSRLGHDLNHPGVNNVFMINAKHDIASRYNNMGVLENYHAATLLEFLSNSPYDIGIDSSDREKIVASILATDMSQHKVVLEKFSESMKSYHKDDNEHRINL